MKTLVLRIFAAGLVASASLALAPRGLAQKPDPVSPNEPKVTICHNGRTIVVAQSAVPAHLAHGDTVGPCASEANVLICHRGRTISVAQSAVATHLAHGDTLGECSTVARSQIVAPVAATPAAAATAPAVSPASSGLVAPTGFNRPDAAAAPIEPAVARPVTADVPAINGLGNPVLPPAGAQARPAARLQPVVSPADEEVAICYKGHTVTVPRTSLKTYLSIGATLGPCADQETAAAQAAEPAKASVEAGK